MKLYGSEVPKPGGPRYDYSELFDDEYHLPRYFVGISIGISIPNETKKILLEDPAKKIQTEDFAYTLDDAEGVPKFIFFRIIKKSLPGSAFNLSEVKKVIFWLHRKYSGDKVFMVEFVFKHRDIFMDIEFFNSLKQHFINKYSEANSDHSFGRWKLLSAVDIWTHEGTSIRLLENWTLSVGQVTRKTYSLAFLDIERTEDVLDYLHTWMKLAPKIRIKSKPELPENNKKAHEADKEIIKITSFELDTLRSSFYVDDKGYFTGERRIHLPFYKWKWKIIEQHIDPQKYFDRFPQEKNKRYFEKIYSYFVQKARSLDPRCYRIVINKENFWRLPFNPKKDEYCRQIFPSSKELEEIYKSNPDLYSSLMHWYSQGFGIPYPIFNITVYNETDEKILITDVVYNVELIDRYLPKIVEHPPLKPFIHELDVQKDIDQRIKIAKTITGLSIESKSYETFSIQLKSKSGIGNICKLKMRFVIKYKGNEIIISDDKLNFITVLSSKPKTPIE